jgi:alpha-galactosidase
MESTLDTLSPEDQESRDSKLRFFSLLRGVMSVRLDGTEIILASGETLVPRSVDYIGRGNKEFVWRLSYPNGLMVVHAATIKEGLLRVATQLSSIDASSGIREIRILAGSELQSENLLDRHFRHTRAMDGFSGFGERQDFNSSGVAAFTDAKGTSAFLCGFGDLGAFQGDILAQPVASGAWRITAHCDFENRICSAGKSVELPPIIYASGEYLSSLLSGYAESVAAEMEILPRTLKVPVGWCSWYCYYGTETEADLLRNLEEVSTFPWGSSDPVFQIDDGWNLSGKGCPRVWGDWHPGQKFPRGMQAIASDIRTRGFRPGLWLAPFSVDKASKLAARHPEWMIQDNGEPAAVGGDASLWALDLTHPEVLIFIRATFQEVFLQWGFEYVKLDFLQHSLTAGNRYDPNQTAAGALRNALQMIRDEAGDERFILCCGSPFGPAIGICDGMRVGLDVGGGWDPPLEIDQWPDGNCCVKAAARGALYRLWMHRNWWINDPDCIVVRDTPSACEIEELGRVGTTFRRPEIRPKHFLLDEEAGFWGRLVWLLGGSAIISDILSHLPHERHDLLRSVFPNNRFPVSWADWYEDPDICLVKSIAGPKLLAIFNLSDHPKDIELPRNKIGLNESRWSCRERLCVDSFSGTGTIVHFPTILPHSARIWEFH